jgi:predicted ArsR family transcriptional regulator
MKKLTITKKITEYIKNNPDAKAKEIAKALGINSYQVHQTVYYIRRKAREASNSVSTLAPNAQASLALFNVPRKRGRPSKIVMSYTEPDNVNSPAHYKAGGIETIDFIEAKGLGYNLGNVIKYVSRADHKGKKLEDLKKAQWYLNREITNMEKPK